MDCSLPGSSVNGILQARILEWPLPPPGALLNLEIEPRPPTLRQILYFLSHQGSPKNGYSNHDEEHPLTQCKTVFESHMGWLVLLLQVSFPGGSVGRESACNAGDLGLIPGLGRSPGEGHGISLQYPCLETPHGQRSLVGYSSWSPKESDKTEQLSTLLQVL